MADSLQASSAMPLPAYQTTKGTQDPVPLSSPASLARTLESRATEDIQAKADDFKAYLDHSTITVVEKQLSNSDFDPADMIARGSVYGNPDGQRPI